MAISVLGVGGECPKWTKPSGLTDVLGPFTVRHGPPLSAALEGPENPESYSVTYASGQRD